jgi:hypothetical protein
VIQRWQTRSSRCWRSPCPGRGAATIGPVVKGPRTGRRGQDERIARSRCRRPATETL